MTVKTLVPFLVLTFGLTWDTLLFATAAVIIVWLNRRAMFQVGSGVTDVLMPEQAT